MALIEDPNADARSLMNRAPCVCDGEKTGIPCKNFWSITQKFAAANADTLRSGEKQRACTLMNGWPLEFVSEEKPTFCNRYEPRKAPGLVAIVRRAIGLGGYEKYDRAFDTYNPMTPEEIAKLREEFPDRPVVWGAGKNPLSMTAQDIATGPQIGIVTPGEKPPETGLSEETEKGLDGIFGTQDGGGIFAKKEGSE